MNELRRAELWFPLALVVVAGIGNLLLLSDSCVRLSERDRGSYGNRPVWQACFDSVSATCGVGLLTYRLDEDYTPLGRWVLVALGVAGAVLALVAGRQLTARLGRGGASVLPPALHILIAFFAWQLLAILVIVAAERVSSSQASVADSAWNAVSLFASLGWLRAPADFPHLLVYAVVALMGAFGWPCWLIFRTRIARPKTMLFVGGTYLAFLLACAALVSALEVPRGMSRGRPTSTERLADQPLPDRYVRVLTLVTCAAGAGVSTEDLSNRSVGEAAKLVLSGVVLVGGVGGSVGGGLRWALVVCVLAGLFGRRGQARTAAARATAGTEPGGHSGSRLGAAYAQLLLGLTLLVAMGLLIIEARTASAFQSPPSLGDALLDGASALGGANLSSGLTATLTNVNLSTGIRQKVDLYQYGMAWLMAAMLVGRVLPVLVLGRMADRHADDAPAPLRYAF
jgi:Trk-type K+ transport system membrane component